MQRAAVKRGAPCVQHGSAAPQPGGAAVMPADLIAPIIYTDSQEELRGEPGKSRRPIRLPVKRKVISTRQTARAEIVADDRTHCIHGGRRQGDGYAVSLIGIHLNILSSAKTKCPFATGFGDSVVGRKLVPRLVVGVIVLGRKSEEEVGAKVPAVMQPAYSDVRDKVIEVVCGWSRNAVFATVLDPSFKPIDKPVFT